MQVGSTHKLVLYCEKSSFNSLSMDDKKKLSAEMSLVPGELLVWVKMLNSEANDITALEVSLLLQACVTNSL